MACLTGRSHSQLTSRFVARCWPGGGGRVESCECLTASGNSDSANLHWPGVQDAEAWSSLPHWQAQITTRFKVVLWKPGPGRAEAATSELNWAQAAEKVHGRPKIIIYEVSLPCFDL